MTNFLDDLDAALIKRNNEEEEKETAHYPSSASIRDKEGNVHGECMRKSFYKKMKFKPSDPLTPTALYPIVFGHILHKGLQDIYSKQVPCEVEKSAVMVDPLLKYPIKGRIDILKGSCGIEIKTVYGRGVPEIKERPKMEHILQAICYCKIFGLTTVEIVYIARDNFNRCVHYLLNDDGIYFLNGELVPAGFGEIRDRWIALEIKMRDNVIPDRDYSWCGECDKKTRSKCKNKCSWQCLYCEYRSFCWNKAIKDEGGDADG